MKQIPDHRAEQKIPSSLPNDHGILVGAMPPLLRVNPAADAHVLLATRVSSPFIVILPSRWGASSRPRTAGRRSVVAASRICSAHAMCGVTGPRSTDGLRQPPLPHARPAPPPHPRRQTNHDHARAPHIHHNPAPSIARSPGDPPPRPPAPSPSS